MIRVLDRCLTNPDTGCEEWQGPRLPKGYGRTSISHNKGVYAHRLAWEQAYGPIPEGMLVCHRCDNPPCCKPEHLFLGTYSDNAQDALAKGRLPRGKQMKSFNRDKTHCKHGHEFSPENTRIERGGRVCITCKRALVRASWWRHREKRMAEHREWEQRRKESAA